MTGLYQMLFCACTVQLVIGGSFERGRIMPSMVFAFCWATIVYCPIACWTWNAWVDIEVIGSMHWLTLLQKWLAVQPPLPRLRWRWTSPHRIRLVRPRICPRPRQASPQGRQDPRQSPQPHTCLHRHSLHLVRLVRLQWWLSSQRNNTLHACCL
jgi:hypothetical protein